VYAAVTAARNLVNGFRADFEAGTLDLGTALQRIREAAVELRQHRTAAVAVDAKARAVRKR
jgi:hypothetical protein